MPGQVTVAKTLGKAIAKRLSPGDKSMLRRIASRSHVGRSTASVMRNVVSRFKGKSAYYKSLPKAQRRQIVDTVAKQHRANRKRYRQVTGGIR